jgi:hypothetical protein
LPLLAICLLSAAPVFADSTTTFTFTGTPGSIGPLNSFTASSLSLVATGYSSSGVTNDMWAKNNGPDQMGLGIANQATHEIAGTSIIQRNVANILAANPSVAAISMEIVAAGETYAVRGFNTEGVRGTLLAMNLTAPNVTLPDLGMLQYISISAMAPGDDSSTMSTCPQQPEPRLAPPPCFLIGLVALVGAGTLGKKLIA